MKTAEPYGIRSTRLGGHWSYCRVPGGGQVWIRELQELLASLAGEADRRLTKAELLAKMRRATEGRLQYGPHLDVEFMSCTACVLEIRVHTCTGASGGTRHIRLYFTEPDHVQDELLALLLISKSPGPIGLAEQNEHARAADRRADEHHS